MPDKFFLPTEHDKQLLQWVIDQVRKMPVGKGLPQLNPRIISSTECYLAKLPEDGIPARESLIAGKAECEIYKIDTNLDGSTLIEAGFTQIVYNTSLAPLYQEYVVIVRDKFGQWHSAEDSEYDMITAVVKESTGGGSGAFTTGDTEVTVDSVEAWGGPSPLDDPDDMDEELVVKNNFNHQGHFPSQILAKYNRQTGFFEIILVDNCGEDL